MTHALCFGCGGIKNGALRPCDSCGHGPTGNLELDIFFTDHYFTRATLEQFGDVVNRIHAAMPLPISSSDSKAIDAVRGQRLLAFVQFISDAHGDLMRVQLAEDKAREARAVLAGINAPNVRVEFSKKAKHMREAGGNAEVEFRAQQTANEKLDALRAAVGKMGANRPSVDGSISDTIPAIEVALTTPDGRQLQMVGDVVSQTFAILVSSGEDLTIDEPHIEFAVRQLREQGHSPKYVLTPTGAMYEVRRPAIWPVVVVGIVALVAAIVLVILTLVGPQ